MVRSINSSDKKKLRGYFDLELPPLTEQAIRSVVATLIASPVDDYNRKIEATIAEVGDHGITLKLPGGKLHSVPIQEILDSDAVFRFWLEKKMVPKNKDFRDPDPTIAARIWNDSYAPALAARIRRAICDAQPDTAEFASLQRSREADALAKAFERRDPATALLRDFTQIDRQGVSETTKKALRNARIGQGKFRREVLQCWRKHCAVTGSDRAEAIRASHIKPWRQSTNEERLDPRNGLPLLANLDALFDAGLITFDSDSRIVVSPQLAPEEQVLFALADKSLANAPHTTTIEYLAYHQRECFRKE